MILEKKIRCRKRDMKGYDRGGQGLMRRSIVGTRRHPLFLVVGDRGEEEEGREEKERGEVLAISFTVAL